ncbi:MAG: hypothetical protein DIU52_002085 [bacterium]|jgi:hypothetical protein|nr:MAG: hypothetical protein DIU52_07930 [bacterium]
MRSFQDAAGREWLADAMEEATPRHHGRWYLVFRPADGDGPVLPMPEVRWQTRETAARTINSMSLTELRRRLSAVLARAGRKAPVGAGQP